ncbi:MAG TPA: type I-E CRISPR-associated endoribonuclease Cas2e [Aldersonia sp.]
MVVIVLTACPAGLRGHLTRWLLEISSGVFVGRATSRVRDRLWAHVVELAKDGKAIMVYSTPGEQGLSFRVHRHHWTPVDVDGIQLMLRPHTDEVQQPGDMRRGWSKASRYRRASSARRQK